MAIEAARLQVVVDADTSKAESSLKSMDSSIRKTNDSFKQMVTIAGGVAIGNAISAAPAMLASLAKASIGAASDLDESMNKVNVVFERSAGEIKRFAEDAATNLGLSEQSALEAAGTFGNLFVSMGMGAPAASDMSQGIVKLAADLGSFNNIGTEEALEKIRAGLVGETEPLRALGVNLSAAAIQAKALSMGLASNAAELTPAMKAQASYALILEQTGTAQGDFARTSDGLANSTKTLNAQVQDLSATGGAVLIPIVTMLTREAITATAAIQDLAGSFQTLASAIPGSGGDSPLPGFVELMNSMPMSLNMVTGSIQGVADSVGWLNEKLGLAEQESQGFITVFSAITTAAQDGSAALLDAQIHAENFANGYVVASDGVRRATEDTSAFTESLGRQAEAAGLANERNSEMALGIELGSGAAAEAAFNLDKLAEAAESAWATQSKLNDGWTAANEAVGFWESNLSNAEEALSILDGEMAENGTLNEEQQKQYDLLTEATGRYKGGIEDTEGAVVDAAVAQAEFITKQDALNQLLTDGKIAPADYAREMAGLTAETDPAASASYNMAGAQGDLATAIETTVNKLGNLLIDLGILPESKRTEFTTPGLDEAKTDVGLLGEGVGALPTSFTITAYADIAPAMAGIQELRDNTPFSPAKKGPFKTLPNWDSVFEELGPAAERHTTEALEHLRDYVNTAKAIFESFGAELDLGQQIAEGGFLLPTDAQLTQLKFTAEHAVQSIADSAALFTTEGLDAAKQFADAGKAIFDLFGSVFDAFAGDGENGLTFPTNDQISQLKFLTEHAVRSIMDSAAVFDSEGVAAAAAYAESASVIMGLLKDATDAYAGLSDIDADSVFEDQVYSVVNIAGMIVQAVTAAAAKLNTEGLAATAEFARLFGEIVGIIKDAADGYAALGGIDADTVWEDQVYSVVNIAAMIVQAVQTASATFSSDGLTAAAEFADSAGAVVAIVSDAVDAYVALGAVDADADVSGGVRAIVALSEQAVAAMIDAAAMFDTDGLEAASEFADSAGSVLGIIGDGVEGIIALGDFDYTDKMVTGLDRWMVFLSIAVGKLEEAAAAFDAEGLEAANQFADAAKSVLDVIGGASDFSGLKTYSGNINKGLDAFFADIRLAIQKLLDLGAEMDAGLTEAAAIAAKISGIVDLLTPAGTTTSGSAGTGGGGYGGQGSGDHGSKSATPTTSGTTNVYVSIDSEPVAAIVSRKIMPAPSIVGVS